MQDYKDDAQDFVNKASDKAKDVANEAKDKITGMQQKDGDNNQEAMG